MWRCCFSQAWVQWTRTLAAALVGTTVPAFFAFAVEPELPPPDSAPALSAWEHTFTVKAGVGYKDNLTLARKGREASPFVATALEAFALREAVDGHQLTLLGSVEDTRYWAGETVDHGDLALAQGEWRRFWPNDWQAALGVETIYLDQVVDLLGVDPALSAIRTNRAVALRAWTLGVRPGTRRELSSEVWLTLEFPMSRQIYNRLLDDSWELGPKMIVGRNYGNESEVSISYSFTHRDYDTGSGREAGATNVLGSTNRLAAQHDAVGAWKHHWDGARRWRSATKLGYRHSSERFSRYFDYERYLVAHELRFQGDKWELSAEARLAYYRYPVQTVSDNDLRKRRRTDLTLALRGERQVASHLRLYAQYEYERTDSNAALDEYTVNTVSGGVAVEF